MVVMGRRRSQRDRITGLFTSMPVYDETVTDTLEFVIVGFGVDHERGYQEELSRTATKRVRE